LEINISNAWRGDLVGIGQGAGDWLMDVPFLIVERDGAVVTATLNRPDERNAISEAAHIAEITGFCEAMAADACGLRLLRRGQRQAYARQGRHVRGLAL
jgi:1,4-dihydroxy-2-naphthoyl-CoA synthase